MEYNLKDKNIETIWEEYPMDFVEYRNIWAKKYTEEEEIIFEEMEEGKLEGVLRISHIGSTAIIDMIAKPVIDIMIEIRDKADLIKLEKDLENIGYTINKYPQGEEPKLIAYKGYDKLETNGYVYHLYIRYLKKWDAHYFRDHLNRNEEARKKYRDLKLDLDERYKDDRLSYRKGKIDFIKEVVEKEKEFYRKYLEELNKGNI